MGRRATALPGLKVAHAGLVSCVTRAWYAWPTSANPLAVPRAEMATSILVKNAILDRTTPTAALANSIAHWPRAVTASWGRAKPAMTETPSMVTIAPPNAPYPPAAMASYNKVKSAMMET